MKTFAIFGQFLLLGLTSFGGPIAHIGFFQKKFVEQKAWFNHQQFAQWIALCHLIPGPSNSQLGFLIGYQRHGWLGAIAAFIGFTLPSALIMSLLAFGWVIYDQAWSNFIHGFILVASAVVIQATWVMARQFCQGWHLVLLTTLCALCFYTLPNSWTPLAILISLAIVGQFFPKPSITSIQAKFIRQPSKKQGGILLIFTIGLLLILPGLVAFLPELTLYDGLYRAGALVFGGGHVVLPYLQIETVETGIITEQTFLTGYSFAQAMPGSLFTFASYLGAVTFGWVGAIIATLTIFLSGLIWIISILPFYNQLIQNSRIQPSLITIQAGVVGFLAATLLNPILPHALIDPLSWTLVTLNLIALLRFKISVLILLPLTASVYGIISPLL